MGTSKCHQVHGHSFREHGGLQIVVEWRHVLKIQHKVFTHFGQLSVIMAKGVEYGRVNTTYQF
jgi:hypothetical protein